MKTPTFTQLEKARAKRGKKNPTLDPNNVREKKCKSCPFGKYGEAIGSEVDVETFALFQSSLAEKSLNEANQYCHADELKGKVSTHVCRGARGFQLKYFWRSGVTEAPTDEAWAKDLSVRESVNLKESS